MHTHTHTPEHRSHSPDHTHQITHTRSHTPGHSHQITHTRSHTPEHTHHITHTTSHTHTHTRVRSTLHPSLPLEQSNEQQTRIISTIITRSNTYHINYHHKVMGRN